VVKERNDHRFRSFSEQLCELHIGCAWGWIATGMVVDAYDGGSSGYLGRPMIKWIPTTICRRVGPRRLSLATIVKNRFDWESKKPRHF
jgi:hypothetical protein